LTHIDSCRSGGRGHLEKHACLVLSIGGYFSRDSSWERTEALVVVLCFPMSSLLRSLSVDDHVQRKFHFWNPLACLYSSSNGDVGSLPQALPDTHVISMVTNNLKLARFTSSMNRPFIERMHCCQYPTQTLTLILEMWLAPSTENRRPKSAPQSIKRDISFSHHANAHFPSKTDAHALRAGYQVALAETRDWLW